MLKTPLAQLHCSVAPSAKGTYRLRCVSPDFKNIGLIGISTVLYANDWQILKAFSQVSHTDEIEQVFLVFSEVHSDFNLNQIESDIQLLVSEKLTPIGYLEKFSEKMELLLGARAISPKVLLKTLPGRDYTLLQVIRVDRPGLLMQISQVLELLDFNILAFTANSEDGMIYDTFKIAHKGGSAMNSEQIEVLTQLLNRQMTF